MRVRSGNVGGRTRFLFGFVAISALVTLIGLPSEPAFAKRMVGSSGADRIVGTNKADRIKARDGHDRVNGGQGKDRLSGGKGADRLNGGKGKDRLSGGKGGDQLNGGQGKDRLSGGKGADHLNGGQGEDGLSGGKGADQLNAINGKKDRAVDGGPGKDVCRIDQADASLLKSCEKVKVATSGGGGGGAGGGGAGKCTAGPPEASQQLAGEATGLGANRELDEDAPPTFSAAFYGITITLNASADGVQGGQLAIGIEEVCDFPKSLAKDATKLAGGDGVAIVGPGTKVYQGGKRLQGQAATAALADLDEVSLRARLKGRGQWARDEDGVLVPTFGASRVTITD